jgi:hypothetical protein
MNVVGAPAGALLGGSWEGGSQCPVGWLLAISLRTLLGMGRPLTGPPVGNAVGLPTGLLAPSD